MISFPKAYSSRSQEVWAAVRVQLVTEGSGRRDTPDQTVAGGPDPMAGASWALAGLGTSKPTAILRGLPVARRRRGWGALTTQPHGWEGSQEDTPLRPSKQGFLHLQNERPRSVRAQACPIPTTNLPPRHQKRQKKKESEEGVRKRERENPYPRKTKSIPAER